MYGTNPNPQQSIAVAHQHLMGTVWAPAFFQKLASDYGIVPQNEQDAERLLLMASQIAQAAQQNVKQAQELNSLGIKAAADKLSEEVTGVPDSDALASNPTYEAWLDKAAEELSSRQDIQEALALMQVGMAQEAQLNA